jgi:hypothetical protein
MLLWQIANLSAFHHCNKLGCHPLTFLKTVVRIPLRHPEAVRGEVFENEQGSWKG